MKDIEVDLVKFIKNTIIPKYKGKVEIELINEARFPYVLISEEKLIEFFDTIIEVNHKRCEPEKFLFSLENIRHKNITGEYRDKIDNLYPIRMKFVKYDKIDTFYDMNNYQNIYNEPVIKYIKNDLELNDNILFNNTLYKYMDDEALDDKAIYDDKYYCNINQFYKDKKSPVTVIYFKSYIDSQIGKENNYDKLIDSIKNYEYNKYIFFHIVLLHYLKFKGNELAYNILLNINDFAKENLQENYYKDEYNDYHNAYKGFYQQYHYGNILNTILNNYFDEDISVLRINDMKLDYDCIYEYDGYSNDYCGDEYKIINNSINNFMNKIYDINIIYEENISKSVINYLTDNKNTIVSDGIDYNTPVIKEIIYKMIKEITHKKGCQKVN